MKIHELVYEEDGDKLIRLKALRYIWHFKSDPFKLITFLSTLLAYVGGDTALANYTLDDL